MLYHHVSLGNPSISGAGELATLLALASSGALTVSSNTSWTNTADAVYRARFSSLTVNAGATLTLANRGVMSILVDGNLTVTGTIDMSLKGCAGAGSPIAFTLNDSASQTIVASSVAAGGQGGIVSATAGACNNYQSVGNGAAGAAGGAGC